MPLPRGLLAEVEDQVRARDALRQRRAPQPRRPDQRLAVGHDERRPIVDGAEVRRTSVSIA